MTATARRAAALSAILIAAFLLRLPCLRGELWFDEIWSLNFARGAGSLAAVLFGVHHDNSHVLNTLWLYLVSGSRDFAVYRLFSFITGLLTVALLAHDEEDPARGLLTAALAAGSAVMVLFSTEARGYAPMAFFAVLCRRLLPSVFFSPVKSRYNSLAFAASALLGFLSHSTFVFVYAGLFAQYAPRLSRRQLVHLFAPAPALMLLLAALQRGRFEIGGAMYSSFWLVAARTLTLWSGAPDAPLMAAVGALILAGLYAREVVLLWKSRDPDFRFHSTLAVSAVVFAAAFPFRSERYFFAALPFVLSLASRPLVRILRGPAPAKALACGLLALYFLGNGARVRGLADGGRGHYLEAMNMMAAETRGATVTVGTDHHLRNPLLLDFYADRVTPPKRIVHVAYAEMFRDPPEWYLAHTFDTDPRLAPVGLRFGNGPSYALAGIFPYSGLSGWAWLVYRRSPAI